MKFKNVELKPMMESLLSLREERLAPKIALAVVKNVSILSAGIQNVEQKRIEIIESYCKKEDGKPVLIDDKGSNEDGTPKIGKKYYFETDDIEKECSAKVTELWNEELDLQLHEILESDIENEDKLTPESVSALLLFTKK